MQRMAALSPERRRLLERLQLQGAPAAALPEAPIVRRAGTVAAPLSFAQERLWLVDQMEPGTPVYNVPAVLRLAGPLDVAVLTRARPLECRRDTAFDSACAAGLAHVPGPRAPLVAVAKTTPGPSPEVSLSEARSVKTNERATVVLVPVAGVSERLTPSQKLARPSIVAGLDCCSRPDAGALTMRRRGGRRRR